MAEKPNCSETPSNNQPARRRTHKLSVLSSVLKTQTSSIQHRACPKIKNKPSGGGGIRMFFIKALIGGGAIYGSSLLGVWGEAEESVKAYSKIKAAICQIDNEKFIPDDVKTDLLDKMNRSTAFLKDHLTTLPQEMKSYYEKSEKYINDLIKGTKP
ncbi:uncharacterized protein LOC129916030 [Episyrphus balteatus]|uniref:uncharacterized protein LOC129916030 n=1 Tax=Episyrphus balteatus TaxID=286459 RepID=UPI0024861459|nr:uncharacterized protein LOC129916030 [Episyrphus balteatus]